MPEESSNRTNVLAVTLVVAVIFQIFLSVLILAALPSASRKQADTSFDDALWIARGSGVWKLDGHGLTGLEALNGTSKSSTSVRAVAVDQFRAEVWLFDGTLLRSLTLDGQSRVTAPFDPAGDTGTPRLVAHDGNVWLGLGKVLYRFDAEGRLAATLPLTSPLRDLVLNVRGDRVRVATEDAVFTVDTSGAFADALALAGVRALAVDRDRGEIWVARGDALERYDARGKRRTVADAAVHRLAADGRGGVWALTRDGLLRFAADGRRVLVLERIGKGATVDLVAHPRAQVAWVATAQGLYSVSATGRVHLLDDLEAVPRPDLALYVAAERPAAPSPSLALRKAAGDGGQLTGPDAFALAPSSPAAPSSFPTPPAEPEVVFTRTLTLDYTGGTTVVLASTEDGTGELLSDDAVRVTVRNNGVPVVALEHDFFNELTEEYEPLAPVDLTGYFEDGANDVTIEILDSRPPETFSEPYFLVQPRNPYSRVLGGESPSVFAVDGSVDLASGNYVRRETDVAAPAPGLGVAFTRTYNSFDKSRGAFGFGWSSPYDSRATVYADGSVEVDLPSGRRAFFKSDGTGFTPELGVFDRLEADGSGYVLTRKSTLVEFHYDDTGRLVEIAEPHGNAVTLSYAGGKPKALVDPAGRRYEIDADSEGRITAVTDPGGFATSYTYDTNGDLVRYVDRRGGEWLYTYADHRLLTVTDPDGVVVVANVYADDGRLIATTDGGGQSWTVEVLDDGRNAFLDSEGDVVMIVTSDERFRVTALEDALGNVTTYEYNEADQVTRIEDSLGRVTSFEYDAAGNLVAVTDPTGARTELSFNGLDRPEQIVDALGNVTAFSYDGVDVTGVDVAGVLDMTIEYDEDGNVTSLANSAGQTLTFTYDAAGNMTSSTDGEGRTTTFTYDELGRRTSATDANGHTTTFTYDGAGNLTSTTDPSGATESRTYDGQGRLTSFTDKLGSTWTWQYDGRGKLTRKTDAEGAVTRLAYDGRGNLLSVTDPNGHVTRFEYNGNNWLERAIDAEGGVTLVVHDGQGRVTSFTDPEDGVLRLEYDGADRVSAMIDPLGNRESFEYDANGRRTRVTDKNGHATTTTYDGAGQVTRIVDAADGVTAFTYNTGADLTSRTDPNGNTTTFVYDDAAQLVEIVDALGGTTLQEYSATGQVIRVTDPNGEVSSLRYDDNDRLVEAIDAEGGVQRFSYDAAGNLTSVTDPNDHVTTFEYDKVYRLKKVTDALGGVATLAYDPVGNLLEAVDPTGAATSFLYDKLDRLVKRTDALDGETTFAYDKNGNRTRITDALGRVTRFTYDKANRQTAITDALDHTTTLVRDPVGNLVESTNRVGDTLATAYDALNRVTEITDPLGGVSSFEYDAAGNVVRTTNAIGTTTNFVYDALNRLITRTDALGGVATLGYDAVGNLTAVTNANGHVLEMAYDGRRRLVSRTDALGGVTALAYDAAGNLLERATPRGSTSRFVYDALNRVTQVTDALEGTTLFSYDARGALSSRTDANGHTASFAYDELNRLTRVTDALEGVTSFTYDAVGNQLTRTDANGNTSSRVYDELNRVAERINALGDVTHLGYDALGRLTSRTDANGHTTGYVYDGLSRLARVIDPLGGETVYSYDAVSNLTGFTDANGNTTSASYDLLNRLLERTDPLGNTYTFAYDPVGNLVERSDGNGDVSAFTYDALNRRVGVEYPDRTGVSLTYDADGNLTGVVNEDESWAATYDALDRMTSVATTEGTLGYAYDPVGNLRAATYPNGETVGYAYDALNRRTSLTDPLGNVTSYAYDPAGNLAQAVYANGHATDYVYDGANRLLDLLTTRSGDGALIYQNSLTLDAVGNPLEIVERFQHGDEPTDYRTVNRTFTYDAYDRLVSEDAVPDWPSGTEVGRDYTYDAVGNVLREDVRRAGPGIKDRLFSDGFETGDLAGWQGQGQGRKPPEETILYAYDAANQLLQAGDEVFRYDGNGNRIEAVAADLTEERYEYDFENRLTGYTRLVPQGQSGKLREDVVAEYAYDGFGRRVGKKVFDNGKPKKTGYLYDAFTYNPIQETSDPGQTTHLYRKGREIVSTREVQSTGAGLATYRQRNWRSDVAVMSNQDGGSVHHYLYTAYGDVLDNNQGLQDSSNFTDPHNHYTLTGKQLDTESGLVYYGVRYYDGRGRRWLTRDPLQGFSFNDPRSYQAYSFDFGNAMRFVDWDGAYIPCDDGTIYEVTGCAPPSSGGSSSGGNGGSSSTSNSDPHGNSESWDTQGSTANSTPGDEFASLPSGSAMHFIPRSNLIRLFCNPSDLINESVDYYPNQVCLSLPGVAAALSEPIDLVLDPGHGYVTGGTFDGGADHEDLAAVDLNEAVLASMVVNNMVSIAENSEVINFSTTVTRDENGAFLREGVYIPPSYPQPGSDFYPHNNSRYAHEDDYELAVRAAVSNAETDYQISIHFNSWVEDGNDADGTGVIPLLPATGELTQEEVVAATIVVTNLVEGLQEAGYNNARPVTSGESPGFLDPLNLTNMSRERLGNDDIVRLYIEAAALSDGFVTFILRDPEIVVEVIAMSILEGIVENELSNIIAENP